jgi:hypothetical protein
VGSNQRKRGAAVVFRRVALTVALTLFAAGRAFAQATEEEGQARTALLEWDADQKLLYASMNFRDVIDTRIRGKLSRGLPTTIVLTATVFRVGSTRPLSTTAQTCKVTWHVWEEAYRVEMMRPGSSSTLQWSPTLEGVLRRCAEIHRLLAGDRTQIPEGVSLRVSGRVQVNPLSPEVLRKIQRWVMRPGSTGTAAPGDALFSTFTGLFLQRIGDAEREVKFTIPSVLPRVFRSSEETR